MKRTHQSYGFSNEPTSEFPDYFQSPWSDNRPIRIIGSSSSSLLPPHDFYSTEHYTGLQETCFLGGSLQARSELEYQYQPSYGPFNLSESEQLLYLRNKLLDDLDDSSRQSPSVPFDASHNLQVSRQFGRSYGYISSTFPCSNSVSSPASISSSKARIRWTPDLHDRFVECVNTLGGPEKATPKAILKLMDTDGLTIFHVKSHLQKYRNAKYTTESAEGRVERPTSSANNNNAADINIKTGMELKEALQLQLDVQRRLHEQLEIQRNLQMRIEEQGKQLKMMFDQQQKTTQSFMQTSDKFPSNSPNIHEEYLEAFVLDGLEEDDDIAFRSKIS